MHQVSSILPESLAEQNQARDREYKRALRDRLCACGKCKRLVCEMREDAQRGVERSEYEKHSETRNVPVCAVF